jgi:hypothetical protein
MQIGEIEAVCHISDNGHFAGDVINNPRELTRWALSIHRSKRLVVRDCCYVMDAIKRDRLRNQTKEHAEISAADGFNA